MHFFLIGVFNRVLFWIFVQAWSEKRLYGLADGSRVASGVGLGSTELLGSGGMFGSTEGLGVTLGVAPSGVGVSDGVGVAVPPEDPWPSVVLAEEAGEGVGVAGATRLRSRSSWNCALSTHTSSTQSRLVTNVSTMSSFTEVTMEATCAFNSCIDFTM